MDAEAVRKINLLECLLDEHPGVVPPPDDAALEWTERQLLDYFTVNKHGATRPQPEPPEAAANSTSRATVAAGVSASEGVQAAGVGSGDLSVSSSCQPGGGIEQTLDPTLDPANAPSTLRTHQLAATVHGYRSAAIADGIPFRPHGLFPPHDLLLAELGGTADSKPFEKHMAGARSPHQLLPAGGWTTGDSAAQAGFDLRMFWLPKQGQQQWGTLVAAVRLGERASIGFGTWTSAHGGAIESVLDEATAELAKLEWATMVSTIEINFMIKKAVPLNVSLRVECTIQSVHGVRCWVEGTIKGGDGKTTYATCKAQLVDLQQLWRG